VATIMPEYFDSRGENLAALEKLCGRSCPEYQDLD
jgi:hypothetical protein